MSFGHRFWKLWGATVVSTFGDGISYYAAFPLLAASLTRDPALVAGVVLASQLPWLILGLASGAIVDRLDRRRLMIGIDVVRAVTLGGFALAVWADKASLAVLYAVAFAMGAAQTFYGTAALAILPSIVPPDRLDRANSRLYSATIGANELAGPPAGAALFRVSPSLPFAIDAVTFAVGSILVYLMRPLTTMHVDGHRGTKLRHEIREGLQWLWQHHLFRILAMIRTILGVMTTAAFSILVLFALEILRLSDLGYGILLAAAALGGILGALVAPRIRQGMGDSAAIVLSLGLTSVSLVALSLTSAPVVAGIFLAGSFCGVWVWNLVTLSLRQTLIPSRLFGRVNNVYRVLGWGSMPLGAALGGGVAQAFGLRAAIFMAGVGLLPCMVWAWLARGRTDSRSRRRARPPHEVRNAPTREAEMSSRRKGRTQPDTRSGRWLQCSCPSGGRV